MPNYIQRDVREWVNRHDSARCRPKRAYDVFNGQAGDYLSGLQQTAATFGELLQLALDAGETLRFLGGGWSISDIALSTGWLVSTVDVNWAGFLEPRDVLAPWNAQGAALLLAQCGTSIYQLHQACRGDGRSLRACGASNGQTIAGAIATGTHGSALRFGAVQDAVRALHIVTAPGRSVWLERRSEPVLTEEFIAGTGSVPVRDDAVFNAALVGLGGMGLIHAVVLETEPAFTLRARRIVRPMASADASAGHVLDAELRRAVETLDFAGTSVLGEDAQEDLFHFEVVVNPHDVVQDTRVTYMVRSNPCEVEDEPPPGRYGPGDDILNVIGKFSDAVPRAVPGIVKFLLNTVFGPYACRSGDLARHFGSTSTTGRSTGAAIGIPLEFAYDALQVAVDAARSNTFPGVLALRFVPPTRATLGFTRFGPCTAILDLDAAQSKRTNTCFIEVMTALERAAIPFTVHWGKWNAWLTKRRMVQMYGTAVDDWMGARHALLADVMVRRTLSGPFLQRLGLDV